MKNEDYEEMLRNSNERWNEYKADRAGGGLKLSV